MSNFWKELKTPFTVLAPMEDVTDTVFRNLVIDCGRPDVLFTEFTSTDGLFSAGRDGVIRRLKFEAREKPIVAQIWGNTPENYYKSGKLLKEMGFDGIDINMGCPVPKVTKKGCCSALIDNPTLAGEIIAAAKEGSCGLPVSVKTRLGFKTKKTEEWTEFLLNQDIPVLSMHGRIAKHMSKYPADWDEIAKVVEVRNQMKKDTLIIGNGDLQSKEELVEFPKKYGVDGVMVARGIFKDPFIFHPTKSIDDMSLQERVELLLKHSRNFVEMWQSDRNINVLKKFFKIYIKDFEGAAEVRAEFMSASSLEEIEGIAGKYLD